MACAYCVNTVPTLSVTSISLDSTDDTALFTLSGKIPTSGRFDIRIGCNVIINPASVYQVTLTDGSTVITNVLAKCGNFLLLGQIANQVSCRKVLHMNATYNPKGNAICLDKLLPPASEYNIKVCGTAVTAE